MKRLCVCLWFLGLFSISQPGVSSPLLKKWETQINQSMTCYLTYSLKSIPQLGIIYYHPGKYGDSLFVLDQEQSTISTVCKKGGGPDQFTSIYNGFSDGTALYFQDVSKNTVLKYDVSDYSLKEIMSTRNFNFSPARLMGKYNTSFLGIYFKYSVKDSFVNAEEYDAVGVFSEDFQHQKDIVTYPRKIGQRHIFDTSFLLTQSLNTTYLIVFYGPNFDPDSGIMKLEVINLSDNSKQYIPINIPKKFYTFSEYEKTQSYYNLLKSQVGIDYKATPSGFRHVNLDFNPTFTYITHHSEAHIETLITILDIETMKISQYIYESKEGIEPYLIAHDSVYCTDTLSEDLEVRVLPKKDVLSHPLKQ